MVDKIRVVKKIEISAERIKKVRARKRLEFFWKVVVDAVKTKDLKIDVTRVRVCGALAKLLSKNGFQWLDVGPAVNNNIKKKDGVFIVEICSGWNINRRRKSAEDRVREMLIG